MKRRVFSAFLALVMALSLIPTAAFAVEDEGLSFAQYTGSLAELGGTTGEALGSFEFEVEQPEEPAAPTLTFAQYTLSDQDVTDLGGTTKDLGTFTGFTADNTNKVTLGGTAKYVEWTGFNGTVTAENKGHYLPIVITGQAGDKFTVTNRSDGSKNGKVHNPANGVLETIIWLDGEKDSYTGTAAADLAEKTLTVKVERGDKSATYTIDFNGVTLADKVVEPETPTLTFAQYTLSDQDVTDLGGTTKDLGTFTGFTADDDNKVTLSGTAKYVEWTGFNGTVTAENKGHYLPLTVTGTAGDKITVTNRSDGSKNGKEHTLDAEGKYETIVWLDGAQDGYAGTAAASLPAKTFTVKVEHDSKATTYSIDFSGVTLADKVVEPETPVFAAATLAEITDLDDGKPTTAFQTITNLTAIDDEETITGYEAVYHPQGTLSVVNNWTAYWPGTTAEQSGYFAAIKVSGLPAGTEVTHGSENKTDAADKDGNLVIVTRLGDASIVGSDGKFPSAVGQRKAMRMTIDGKSYLFVFDKVTDPSKVKPEAKAIFVADGANLGKALQAQFGLATEPSVTETAKNLVVITLDNLTSGTEYTLSMKEKENGTDELLTNNIIAYGKNTTTLTAESAKHYIYFSLDEMGDDGQVKELSNDGTYTISVTPKDGTAFTTEIMLTKTTSDSNTTWTGDPAYSAGGTEPESLSLTDVHYASAADTITVKVTGNAKYVELPGFNATVPAEQKGHYMPITITGGVAGEKLTLVNRSAGAMDGKELTFEEGGVLDTVVWLDGTATDGTKAAALAEDTFTVAYGGKTYVVNFSNVKMEEAPVVKYTVTFDTAGGSAVEAQTVEKDQKATRPEEAPTKTGYTFKDWFTTADGDTAFDFNTAITADTTVYAQWTKKESTVETETEVKEDGTATTEVDHDAVADAITKAEEAAEAGEIPVVVIDTTTTAGAADAPKAETSIPASTAAALGEKAAATIVTNVGEVTVSKDVMAAVDSTSDKPLVLTTEKDTENDTVTVNLTQDGQSVEFTAGTVTATIPTSYDGEADKAAVYYVNEAGKTVPASEEDCTVTVVGGKATVTFHNPNLMGKKISIKAKATTPDPTPSDVTYKVEAAATGALMTYNVTVEHMDANAVLTIQVRPDGCTSGPVFYAEADATGKVEFGVPTNADLSMWVGKVVDAGDAAAADSANLKVTGAVADGTFTAAEA